MTAQKSRKMKSAVEFSFYEIVASKIFITLVWVKLRRQVGQVALSSEMGFILASFLSCCSIPKISYFLERILMEDIVMKNIWDSKLFLVSICSVRNRSRKWDIYEISQQHNFNPYVDSIRTFNKTQAFGWLVKNCGSTVKT